MLHPSSSGKYFSRWDSSRGLLHCFLLWFVFSLKAKIEMKLLLLLPLEQEQGSSLGPLSFFSLHCVHHQGCVLAWFIEV